MTLEPSIARSCSPLTRGILIKPLILDWTSFSRRSGSWAPLARLARLAFLRARRVSKFSAPTLRMNLLRSPSLQDESYPARTLSSSTRLTTCRITLLLKQKRTMMDFAAMSLFVP